MTGLYGDSYTILSRLDFNGGSVHDSVTIHKEGNAPGPETGPVMDLDVVLSSSNVTEGEMVWVDVAISLGSSCYAYGIFVTVFMNDFSV